jgi:hypothetical protein
VPELVGLDYLVGLTNLGRYDAYGVLKGNPGNRQVQEKAHELKGFRLFLLFLGEVSSAGHGKVSARWMADSKVVFGEVDFTAVTLYVGAGPIGGQKVA